MNANAIRQLLQDDDNKSIKEFNSVSDIGGGDIVPFAVRNKKKRFQRKRKFAKMSEGIIPDDAEKEDDKDDSGKDEQDTDLTSKESKESEDSDDLSIEDKVNELYQICSKILQKLESGSISSPTNTSEIALTGLKTTPPDAQTVEALKQKALESMSAGMLVSPIVAPDLMSMKQEEYQAPQTEKMLENVRRFIRPNSKSK